MQDSYGIMHMHILAAFQCTELTSPQYICFDAPRLLQQSFFNGHWTTMMRRAPRPLREVRRCDQTPIKTTGAAATALPLPRTKTRSSAQFETRSSAPQTRPLVVSPLFSVSIIEHIMRTSQPTSAEANRWGEMRTFGNRSRKAGKRLRWLHSNFGGHCSNLYGAQTCMANFQTASN